MTAIAVVVPICARAQGYPDYPYSIMTPERGVAPRQRASTHRGASTEAAAPATAAQPHHPSLLGREEFIAELHRHGLYAARG